METGGGTWRELLGVFGSERKEVQYNINAKKKCHCQGCQDIQSFHLCTLDITSFGGSNTHTHTHTHTHTPNIPLFSYPHLQHLHSTGRVRRGVLFVMYSLFGAFSPRRVSVRQLLLWDPDTFNYPRKIKSKGGLHVTIRPSPC